MIGLVITQTQWPSDYLPLWDESLTQLCRDSPPASLFIYFNNLMHFYKALTLPAGVRALCNRTSYVK